MAPPAQRLCNAEQHIASELRLPLGQGALPNQVDKRAGRERTCRLGALEQAGGEGPLLRVQGDDRFADVFDLERGPEA